MDGLNECVEAMAAKLRQAAMQGREAFLAANRADPTRQVLVVIEEDRPGYVGGERLVLVPHEELAVGFSGRVPAILAAYPNTWIGVRNLAR